MKRASTLMMLFLATILAGCAEEEPPPPPMDLAPRLIPTQRVLSDFYKASGINEPLPSSPNAVMTAPAAQRLVTSVNGLKSNAAKAEEPDVIIATVIGLLRERIKEAEAKNLWSFLPPYVDAYQTLQPDDKTYQPLADLAKKQMNRPKVALRGLYHDHSSGMTTASLRVFDPLTRETTSENLRMGEQLRGIKFTKVVGKDEGIELEVEATGMIFQVMKGDGLK